MSLQYSNTKNGRSRYQTYLLGLSFRPAEWLQVTASIPYTFIDGYDAFYDETAPGVERKNVFTYSSEGIGDVVLMGWVNAAPAFLPQPPEAGEEKSGDPPGEEPARCGSGDPLEGIGKPNIYLGLGVKLATGSDDEFDLKKYRFDRSKAVTGEYSKSDGIRPARFQLGTGTYDLLLGAFYQQRFGRWTPYMGLSWQLTSGENSVEYERGDTFSWVAGTQCVLYCTSDCRQLYVRGGISGVISAHDIDHSEDTTKLGKQSKGRVPDTRGTYHFFDLGGGYDLTENLSVFTTFRYPLNDPVDVSENSFDWQFSVGLQYRF